MIRRLDQHFVADLRNIDGYQQGVRGDRLSIGHGRSLRNGARTPSSRSPPARPCPPRAARACCLETARAAGSATSPNSFRRCYGLYFVVMLNVGVLAASGCRIWRSPPFTDFVASTMRLTTPSQPDGSITAS